jgi:serine-type D-Ala-D-Ala carboxypeptidase (penicillin-binding protein 5/6)
MALALAAALAVSAPVSSAAAPVQSAPSSPGDPLPLAARAAILVDAATGRVLYEHNADQPFVPASLAKLMSLHIIYQELEDGTIKRSDVVSLSRNAWADHQVPGSSLMNLGPGQIVTVEELMKGMAVASGNDAAVALAEYVAGSAAAFVARMNDEARFMGYTTLHFTDPAGVRTDNSVTAREFADFCRRYVALHPEALSELHSVREFDYPLAQNLPLGVNGPATKKQFNGNYLVGDWLGVDGLKTGHLDDRNFTAAITARRGGTRLIAVLLGVPGRGLKDGSRARAEDGVKLLTYGFRSWSTITLDPPPLPPVRVWKGAAGSVPVQPQGPVQVTARPDETAALTYSVLLETPVSAPVLRGRKLGDIVYSAGSVEIARVPLVAGADVDAAGPLRRLWDSMLLGLSTAADWARGVAGAVLDTVAPQAVASAGRSDTTERRAP